MPPNNNIYHHDTPGFFGALIENLSNSTRLRGARRAIFRLMPFLKLESDVSDVIYINWLVEKELVSDLVPKGVELFEINGKTLFSILTYRHGNFHPQLFSLLKFLFPSPLQSNWRLYASKVMGRKTPRAVVFIKNVMNDILFVVGTRLISDAMLTHHSKHFKHLINSESIVTEIIPTHGSSPKLISKFSFSQGFDFPQDLLEKFGSELAVLNYICIQDTAYTEGADFEGLCEATISLPIELATIKPLKVDQVSLGWLSEVVQNATPFAFMVPSVKFQVINETVVNLV